MLTLTVIAISPARPYGVDYISAWQPVCFGDLCAAGFTAAKGAAFFEKIRASSTVDTTIDSATTQ